MKRLLLIYSMLPAFFLGAALCSNGAGQTAPPSTSKSLALGLVATSHQREIEEHFRDFVFYLSRQYHSAADAEGKVVVAATVAELDILGVSPSRLTGAEGNQEYFLHARKPRA